MSTQVLNTKLYTPVSRPGTVPRQRLIRLLNAGLHGKLTLISAPAGFGKTRLVAEWVADSKRPVAWLSLDESDSDPVRFLTYVVAALQTVVPKIGAGIMNLLESPQPPQIDSMLTPLLNEIATMPQDFVLVLDDYHVLDSTEIDSALAFIIDNQPPRIHLVITTREDPRLPLARLRARGQLNELRVANLRFTPDEATEFLNNAMGLALSPEDIDALEQRTEGWIAGLQLAAISMHGVGDKSGFIQTFTGNHHFILDYLIEEVLSQQSRHIHDFLLKTSILDRMCGSLCDAILQDSKHTGAEVLESIRQANLFLIPLDNERCWYRYHHLFGDLLRKRLGRSPDVDINGLHIRASEWYETTGLEVEAFQHASVAGDIRRAERLVQGAGVPLYFRGVSRPVLTWLESLPDDVLDERPSLWLIYAWTLMAAHRNTQIEQTLILAEKAISQVAQTDQKRDLLGQIAAIRAMEAAIFYQSDSIIAQAHRALALLNPENLYVRAVVTRSLAIAYQYQGKRSASRETYQKAIAMSEASDNLLVNILATTGLGIIQLSDNQLYEASESFHRVFGLVGDPDQPVNCVANLRLAQIYYEWNDLDSAQRYGERGVHLAQQIEGIDSAAGGKIFLARVRLAQGDFSGALSALDEVEHVIRQRDFLQQIPALVEAKVDLFLRVGNVREAERLTTAHDLQLIKARVSLAEGSYEAALELLVAYREKMAEKAWYDEHLKALVLEAVARHQSGSMDEALATIGEAMDAVASAGFVRTFVDIGPPIYNLLLEASARGMMPSYTRQLLAAFGSSSNASYLPSSLQPLIEPLSERELEILALVADGLSNREISERLYIALSTVKGHNRNIFDKLHVKRRTEAVARARELGLI
ncbi:MAG: LuxR C-terminal-related transcriptional regulator [Aggregatilineales bacterium]